MFANDNFSFADSVKERFRVHFQFMEVLCDWKLNTNSKDMVFEIKIKICS